MTIVSKDECYKTVKEQYKKRRIEMLKLSYPHVSIDRNVLVGEPCIEGTRITVALIAEEVEHLGMTPDDVIAVHPQLLLAQVHAALVYYYDHKNKIDVSIRKAKALESKLRHRFPPKVKELLLEKVG